MRQDPQRPKIRLILGVVSLSVGLFAGNLALFNWIERAGLSYVLANYARYVCAYGGFGAMIFGAMLVNEFFVRKEFLKRRRSKSELKMYVDVKENRAAPITVGRRPRKKVSKTVRRA